MCEWSHYFVTTFLLNIITSRSQHWKPLIGWIFPFPPWLVRTLTDFHLLASVLLRKATGHPPHRSTGSNYTTPETNIFVPKNGGFQVRNLRDSRGPLDFQGMLVSFREGNPIYPLRNCAKWETDRLQHFSVYTAELRFQNNHCKERVDIDNSSHDELHLLLMLLHMSDSNIEDHFFLECFFAQTHTEPLWSVWWTANMTNFEAFSQRCRGAVISHQRPSRKSCIV